jgi:hypothetical protein
MIPTRALRCGLANNLQDISEPQDARRIEDEPQPQEIYNSEGITHQPSSAMDTDRPRDNHNAYLTDAGQAGQTEFAPPEELGMSHPEGNPNVQIIEKKLPFKEQVRAYNKVHRGTVSAIIVLET